MCDVVGRREESKWVFLTFPFSTAANMGCSERRKHVCRESSIFRFHGELYMQPPALLGVGEREEKEK